MRRAEPSPDSRAVEGLDPQKISRDALLDGVLSVLQPRSGYRINVDSLLLAAFAAHGRKTPFTRVVDLGAGVGAVTLALHYFTGIRRADLVERESDLSTLAALNLRANGVDGSVHVADLSAEGLPPHLRGVAAAVVVNPPFYPAASTRPQKEPTLRRARSGTITPFLVAAANSLGRRGKAYFVYPSGSLAQLLGAAEQRGLIAKRLRFVHSFSNTPARLSLVEFSHGKPGGLVVEPPLVEWQARGVPSPDVTALLSVRANDRK